MGRPLRLKRKQGGGSSSNLPTSDGALKVLDLSSALFAHDYGTDANLMFSCFFLLLSPAGCHPEPGNDGNS